MVAGSGIKSEDSATQKAEGSRFLADLCSRAACPLANDFVWSVQQAGLDACDKAPAIDYSALPAERHRLVLLSLPVYSV